MTKDSLEAPELIPLKSTTEKGFAVLVLLLFSGALLPFLWLEGGTFSEPDASSGDPRVQVVWVIIYLVTFFLLAARWQYAVQVAARNKLLWVLVGIALTSVLWSDVPDITLRQGVALIGSTAFGLYFAARYKMSEQQRLLRWALAIAAVLSLAFALALPSYGVQSDIDGQGWRGIYSHKNTLGSIMALSTLVFLLRALTSRKRRWVAGAGLILSFGLVIFSNSVSSLVVCVLLLALLPVYRALRWRITLAVPFLISAWLLGGGVVMWGLYNAETILGALGRDITLTGRTNLWPLVITMISQRPWLGYGYSGFWEADKGAYFSFALNGFQPTSAHNGFLDLWLQLGLLGVLVFVLSFLLAFLRAAAWARLSKATEGLWPLMYLTFMLLHSVSESSILIRNDIYWTLYTAAVFSLPARQDSAGSTGGEKQTHQRAVTPDDTHARMH
jgi:exopolysaccharide production protein ExoQ